MHLARCPSCVQAPWSILWSRPPPREALSLHGALIAWPRSRHSQCGSRLSGCHALLMAWVTRDSWLEVRAIYPCRDWTVRVLVVMAPVSSWPQYVFPNPTAPFRAVGPPRNYFAVRPSWLALGCRPRRRLQRIHPETCHRRARALRAHLSGYRWVRLKRQFFLPYFYVKRNHRIVTW